MSANNGGPAFPQPIVDTRGNSGIVSAEEMQVGGMTLRDYFAAKAMQGLVASCNNQDRLEGILGFRKISEAAYAAADAMLKARNP